MRVKSLHNNLNLCLIPLISTQRHEPTRKLPWWFSIGRIIWHLASFLPPSFHSDCAMKVPSCVVLQGAQLCSEELDQEKTMDETSVSFVPLPLAWQRGNRSSSRCIWKVFALSWLLGPYSPWPGARRASMSGKHSWCSHLCLQSQSKPSGPCCF